MSTLPDPFAGRPALDDATLAFLRGVDSPTVANAVETFGLRDRCDGFIGGQILCQFPDLGTMVGRALTVTMSNAPGPVAGKEGYWRLWEALEACSGPVVLAVADASGSPQRVAFAGEIMATLAQRLGAVGMVTDGAFRDVAEVHALGMHYFMKYPVVSHANFWIETVGEPVVLDSERIETGDILHGDRNGIVVIPDAALSGLEAAVGAIRTSEAADMAFIRGEEFTLDGLKARKGYGSPA